MRALKNILRHFERMPRGYAADGRMLGLGLATAIDSSRELDSAGEREATARANAEGHKNGSAKARR